MGASASTSVVDPWGKMWDTDNVYIADGGILPSSLGVNPQLTIMTMATRIAWYMAQSKSVNGTRVQPALTA